MSEIALYNTLTKLGVEPDEAERAVADVASSKEVATKADIVALKSEFKAEIAKIKIELKYMRWVGLIFVMNVAILIKLFS